MKTIAGWLRRLANWIAPPELFEAHAYDATADHLVAEAERVIGPRPMHNDFKRRYVMNRLIKAHPGERTRDLALAIEFAVRRLKRD